MNKKFVFMFVFISFFVLDLYTAENKNSLDELITEIYLENGYNQLEAGNYKEALNLADIALSFSEDSSDSLYIRSAASRNLGLVYNQKKDLSDAIIFNNWKYYKEINARADLSEYMYMEGYIEDAYLNLQPFINQITYSSKISELYIRIALSVKKVNEALLVAGNFLKVDPYDNYSQLIMAMYDPVWLGQAEKILLDGDPSKFVSKGVYQYIIRKGSDCEFLNELYISLWGKDRFFLISNLCKNNYNLSEILQKLYPDNSIVNFIELTWLYSLFEDNNSKQIILNWLSSIHLTIEYDSDYDGFNDTEAFYEKGKLYYFKFDSNHDKNYDYMVEIDENPVSLIVESRNGRDKYTYKNYPYLINVLKSSDHILEEFKLIPNKLTFEIIFIPDDFTKNIPNIIENVSFPDNSILTDASAKKIVTNISENIISEFSIIGLDEIQENVFNSNDTKIIERHYKKSVLISVFKDFNTDGLFDAVYEYKDGLLQSISFDDNNNGIYEYTENYQDSFVSSWDFNEDGLIDSKEYNKNGIIFREFSSKMDGIFDTSIEINNKME